VISDLGEVCALLSVTLSLFALSAEFLLIMSHDGDISKLAVLSIALNLAAKFSESFLALLDALSSGSVIVHNFVKR